MAAKHQPNTVPTYADLLKSSPGKQAGPPRSTPRSQEQRTEAQKSTLSSKKDDASSSVLVSTPKPSYDSAPSCLECALKPEDDSLILLNCKEHSICRNCLEKRGSRKSTGTRSIFECVVPHARDKPHVSSAEQPDNVWIYVDDSNLWIEAMKLASKESKFKTKQDHRIRIDVGKLTNAVANGRPVIQGFLYGSEPPPIDTVWDKIEQRGWKVDKKKKHQMTGKEKKVDTQLVADITERACNTPYHERSTIIMIAGDADMMPAIDKILKNKGWKVEIYMWKSAMAAELKQLSSKAPIVKVCYLDDELANITFTNMRFSPTNDQHLPPRVKATSVVFTMKEKAFKRRVPTRNWCRRLENLAQWPFQYYWFKDHDGMKMNDLLIVFKSDSKAGEIDITQLLENIEQCKDADPIPHLLKAETYLVYEQRKSGLAKYGFESMGRYSSDDCCKGLDLETLSVTEDDSGQWNVVSHTPRSRLHKAQKYSDRCPYKFNCKYGSKCENKHTEKEKQFFKQNMGRGIPSRKVKPCIHYQSKRCSKNIEECKWAHGKEDAWCLICCEQGHYTNDCPNSDRIAHPTSPP